jgi:Icc-related predicted phosphoesterase
MKIDRCDVLVHCGDACVKGNLTEALDFLYWFVKQPASYKVLVPGNHDLKLKTHPDALLLAKQMGIHLLNNGLVELEGIRIYGVSTTFKGHDDPRFKDSEWGSISDRVNAWKDIPENLDLLITHQPPYGVLDLSIKNEHLGCQMLLEKVREVKPKYHYFGHIHEQAGKTVIAFDTEFNNVACMNREYELISSGYDKEI